MVMYEYRIFYYANKMLDEKYSGTQSNELKLEYVLVLSSRYNVLLLGVSKPISKPLEWIFWSTVMKGYNLLGIIKMNY